jgi:hypothetical protein
LRTVWVRDYRTGEGVLGEGTGLKGRRNSLFRL